jgi:proteasome lid subunit RPN8/RPN11
VLLVKLPSMSRWGAALLAVLACASQPSRPIDPSNYGYKGKEVWVNGPWPAITSSRDVDEVIDQLCPAIMKLPRAAWRDYGQEYCGVIYSLGDGIYRASHPSPLGPTVLVGPAKRKQCQPPRIVHDALGRAVPWADYHSHPWAPSEMTEDDRRANLQLFHIRIQFDAGCTVMKLIPYLSEDRPGEMYVRNGKQWVLTGYILPEDKRSGRLTPVDE